MNQNIVIPVNETLRETAIQRLGRVVRGLAKDGAWAVEIKPYKPRRSDNQNRYLWGVVYKTILDTGQLDGWSAEDVHEYMLGEHFGWETIEGFGKKRLKPLRRSSVLSKVEFVAYVEFIQRKCADLGIYVPDPNEMAA